MKILMKLLFSIFISMLFFACKKDNAPLETPRIFKVSNIKVSSGETSATLTWDAPLMSTGKSLTYTVDVAEDSTFATVDFTYQTDSLQLTVTDDSLKTKTHYYARVKADATATQPESKYLRTTSYFQITGLQLFLVTRDNELKENSVVLRFTPTIGLSSLTLSHKDGKDSTVTLSATDASDGVKSITGLQAATTYTANLYLGTRNVGTTSFTTLAKTNYSVILNEGDDLATVIQNAANGNIIGLNPGTYSLLTAAVFITQKTITLKSTSGNPSDTKINIKELDLEGTGAGLSLSGLEIDGTTSGASYIVNLIGSQSNNASAATFTNVDIDNCIVHGAANCLLRGDRGSAANTQQIGDMSVRNSLIYDIGSNGGSTYYLFNVSKLQFGTISVSKSTLYNFGPGVVIASTVLTGAAPSVTIDHCTMNGWGGASKYLLLDANANPVNFNLKNSIFANSPKAGTINANALRSSGSNITTSISNCDYFNLLSALSGGSALAFPTTVSMSSNQVLDLGWTTTTTDFALSASSPLRTAGDDGKAIGDPRWTY
ncbi:MULTISPECIES: fibronectin type III domain-containing protein [Chitinophagaceae]